jgi:hypothetical protein
VLKHVVAIVLSTFLQASSQVPGKAVQSHRANANSGKSASAPNKAPAAPVRVRNPVESNNPEKGTQTPASKDELKNTAVTVPTIIVRKDYWDYAYIAAKRPHYARNLDPCSYGLESGWGCQGERHRC